MRISDWSSDVCSSDLLQEGWRIHRDADAFGRPCRDKIARFEREGGREIFDLLKDVREHHTGVRRLAQFAIDQTADIQGMRVGDFVGGHDPGACRAMAEIGRASCGERGCQSGWVTVGAVPLKKKK